MNITFGLSAGRQMRKIGADEAFDVFNQFGFLYLFFAMQESFLLISKLEFGRYENRLLLGDEFTPDGCRLWDLETKEKLDKDRFRQGLGDVVESYEIAASRLGIVIP